MAKKGGRSPCPWRYIVLALVLTPFVFSPLIVAIWFRPTLQGLQSGPSRTLTVARVHLDHRQHPARAETNRKARDDHGSARNKGRSKAAPSASASRTNPAMVTTAKAQANQAPGSKLRGIADPVASTQSLDTATAQDAPLTSSPPDKVASASQAPVSDMYSALDVRLCDKISDFELPQQRSNTTFGLVTRIYSNDLPYVGSFIQHYQNLGVSKFYFALTRQDDLQNVSMYLNDVPFFERNSWALFKNSNAEPAKFPVGILGDMLKWVTEEFVAQVDIDEYISLPCGIQDFAELVASEPAISLFRFGWVAVSVDDRSRFIVQPPYRGVVWQGSKYLVRRSAVARVPRADQRIQLNCVEADTTCGVKAYPKSLVHFYMRSLGDAVAKAVGAHSKNSQDSTPDQLRQLLKESQLPPRLKAAAYLSLASADDHSGVLLDSEKMPILTIDRKEETRLLRNYGVSEEVLSELQVVFGAYKRSMLEAWTRLRGSNTLADIDRVMRIF